MEQLNTVKAEREKNKAILLATLEYLIRYHSNELIFDEINFSKQRYLDDLKKTESDIAKYRHKQIERRLYIHLLWLRHRFDYGLTPHIRKNTGYDFDLFETYKLNVSKIPDTEAINSMNFQEVENYIRAYDGDSAEKSRVDLLKSLLSIYAENNAKYSHDVFFTREIHVYETGKKMKTYDPEEYEAIILKRELPKVISPNGNQTLQIQFVGKGDNAQTQVIITLKGGGGCLYIVKGKRLPIKAYWHNDHHIRIETRKTYTEWTKHNRVSSYEDVVEVEYLYK